jgi:hypothetical protein
MISPEGAGSLRVRLSSVFRHEGIEMDIGKPRRTVTVEPVEDPVPRESPVEPPEREPADPPREPEKLPA